MLSTPSTEIFSTSRAEILGAPCAASAALNATAAASATTPARRVLIAIRKRSSHSHAVVRPARHHRAAADVIDVESDADLRPEPAPEAAAGLDDAIDAVGVDGADQ